MALARESHPYLIVGLGVTLGGAVLGFPYLAAGALLISMFVAFFFRDPERDIPAGEDLVVSPGDGRVVEVLQSPEGLRISIFLSLFDVHINRIPVGGVIRDIRYRAGRFLPANMQGAALHNERNDLLIAAPWGEVRVAQIAGVVARRIVCWKKAGDRVQAGERFGLIQFGSRMEVLLPAGSAAEVGVGARVKGGSSILGRMPRPTAHGKERELAQTSAR